MGEGWCGGGGEGCRWVRGGVEGGGGEIVLARKCLRGGRLREMESLVKDDLFIVCMLTVLFIVCMLKNTIHLYSE